MDSTKNLLTNLCHLLVCACEVFRYIFTFLWAILCPRAVLAAKLLAAQGQLAVCKHRIGAKTHPPAMIYCEVSPPLGRAFKVLG